MSRNMNNSDRALRTFLAAPAAIIAAFAVGPGSIAGIVLFALAAIMLATSAIGFCLQAAAPRHPRPHAAAALKEKRNQWT